MRDILAALTAGDISVEEAESALSGYITGEHGRFDVAREQRRGIPEAILAAGKTPTEVASLCDTALTGTGHAIVTRSADSHRDAIRAHLEEVTPTATLEIDERSGVVIARMPDHDRPTLDATVGVIAAGTADAGPAGEAAIIAREIGATVTRIDDVGVANLTRITDQLPTIRGFDVVIVAAGREGALPTVVAGLISAPVIGLPISTGYGYGGNGNAALSGMLQSCTILSVVNIDAGFVAGAQAGLIARTVDRAMTSS